MQCEANGQSICGMTTVSDYLEWLALNRYPS